MSGGRASLKLAQMKQRIKSMTVLVSGGSVLFIGLNIYGGNEKFYRQFVMPLVRMFPPESVHLAAVQAAKYGFVPRAKTFDAEELVNSVWGLEFENPIGVAAGFDKHCEAVPGLIKAGFSFVEIGTVTPKPQPGNPKPRVFRLEEDEAIINRYGFNSVGHDVFLERLVKLKNRSTTAILGVSLGKNKESSDPIDDYVEGVNKFVCLCDYIAINVSSPNTPGLRQLQGRHHLEKLVDAVLEAREKRKGDKKALILVKLAPDLNDDESKAIAQILARKKIDGVIISNTTISRPETLVNGNRSEGGGLSGRPIREMSTKMIYEFYKHSKGEIPIIGVGGISSGQDAYEKIKAGASLLQVYTAMIYVGPTIASSINAELLKLIRADGYSNIKEAIGSAHR